jgi:N-acetylglutamate synthase/N-acetylornithine aminotransferase
MKLSSEVSIVLCVGGGPGTVEYWASDLTTEYVEFNSEYTT